MTNENNIYQSKNKVKTLLTEICKGNVLLCKKGEAGQFSKDLSPLLVLVGRLEGNLITVPYYDVKRVNLWQDFFVWFGKNLLDLDLCDSKQLEQLYKYTSSARAQGYPLYLNSCKTKWPERVSVHDILKVKTMASCYPALDQVHDNYNQLKIKPRFNVIEALVNWHKSTGQWLDPYWLEQQSKEWITIDENYIKHRDALMLAEYTFDDPRFTERFTFVKEPEKVNDLGLDS